MKKYIALVVIIFLLAVSFLKQSYAIERADDSIQSYPEQTKLYRELYPLFCFKYQYQPGDKLRYKVQVKSWIKSYVDAGPRAFHPTTVDLILEEQINKVADSNIELAVKVTYKNAKEPLYWGSSIAIHEAEGEVLVILYKNSWIPEIFNINTKNVNDFNVIKDILSIVIPQVNRPIFFLQEPLDGEAPPGYLIKDIDGYAWASETNGRRFTANMYSIIRTFENFRNFRCAIFDNMIAMDLDGGGEGAIFGTVYFDYESGKVIKLDYSSSEEFYRHNSKDKLKGVGYAVMSAELLE